jgi:hypothetical protein
MAAKKIGTGSDSMSRKDVLGDFVAANAVPFDHIPTFLAPAPQSSENTTILVDLRGRPGMAECNLGMRAQSHFASRWT